MLNIYSPPIFGALVTESDPEGHDSNFLWDDSPYRMQPSTSNLPRVRGLTSQSPTNSCVSRSFKEACDTLTGSNFSWSAAYMGGWAQLHGGLGWPMEYQNGQDVGLRGGSLPLLQWAALHGCLNEEEWPSQDLTEPPIDLYYSANRTIDFAQIAPNHLIPAIRGACNLGIPVMLDCWIDPSFFNVSGPFDTHRSQYFYPFGVARALPNLIHNICAVDITPEYVICANHSGPSYGFNGFIALDFSTLSAAVLSAYVITRIGATLTPPVPEVMIFRPCPGRESLGPQFTRNVCNYLREAFFNPAHGTIEERATATLAAMTEYGITRDEAAYCAKVDRSVIDAFLALAQ